MRAVLPDDEVGAERSGLARLVGLDVRLGDARPGEVVVGVDPGRVRRLELDGRGARADIVRLAEVVPGWKGWSIVET